MKVKDPYFVLEKIAKYIEEDIRPTRIRKRIPIRTWRYLETSMEERVDDAYRTDYDDSGWKAFQLWDTWGGYDRVAWFRAGVEIPEEMRGHTLALRILAGPRDGGGSTAECLLYVDGHPVQAIDIWHEEAILEPALCEKDRLDLALKAWSGVLDVPRFRTFKEAELIELDMRVDRFCFVADTLRRCILQLDENDLRRIRLTGLLDRTFRKIDFLNYGEEDYYRSVYRALDYLQGELDKLGQIREIKPSVYGVGHSHIDMAWLWRLSATREKASRTFATVLNLMRQYPEYRFMHSSPQLYQFLKQDYPEIYARVKERIEAGQWEITGGMWVEADTNIPSGESLIRQFLYGKRFIREEFGRETKLVWLPDVFGYSAALPQIMKKCGMQYFMTTKISWNQYNQFPHDTFLWKGIDGTEIFTHFITTPEDGSWFYTYNGHMDPEEVAGIWKNYKDKDKNDKLLIAFGWGDGGGGPTREMLEQSRVMKNIPGIPTVEITKAEEYFEEIWNGTDHGALGKWDGELYFELHRGTYTSQAANKRYNRKTEILLHNIEYLYALCRLTGAEAVYPREEMDRIWERVLLNQFHDIIPGSSIRQVYEDTTRDYEAIQKRGQELLGEALDALGKGIDAGSDCVAVYNTTGYRRDDYIFLPYGAEMPAGSALTDGGNPVPLIGQEDGVLAYVAGVPAYGRKLLRVCREQACGPHAGENAHAPEAALSVTVSGEETALRIESPYYEIRLNENGEIAFLYDRENGRRVDCGRPMNVLQAYEDKPQRFDAWDVDIYYKEKPYEAFRRTKCQVIEQGERAVIRQAWAFNRSVLTQDMIVYARSRRIDFVTTADWKEKQVFLKAYFPVDVHAQEATYEIQFGSIKRPVHSNTQWDLARFEVPGHRWADLSQGGYGVAILNDCKYGYDVQENRLGLSLIKSAVRPDETADRKIHQFTYALYPHAGAAEASRVQEEAVGLNMPLLSGPVKGGGQLSGAGAPKGCEAESFVCTGCGHIQIDTVKPSEDGEAVVVRLYEYKNQKEDNVFLKTGFPVAKVCECDPCEEHEREMPAERDGIRFSISGFEIRTFKFYVE